jgi:acetyl esterase/lipase
MGRARAARPGHADPCVADPLTDRAALATTAAFYRGRHDSTGPLASPVYIEHNGLRPVMTHTGGDDVLMDDTVRFEIGAPDIETHVWVGMVHVFPSSVGALQVAARALELTGAFLRRHLGVAQDQEHLQ